MITVPVSTIEKPLRFGRLSVHAIVRRASVLYYCCRCDCGTEKEIAKTSVASGRTKSCGCLEREARLTSSKTHGMSRTATYQTWLSLVRRCTEPSESGYQQYGGRGIKVCERWLKFENFFADMGVRPRGTSIERTDNDGDYSPENCRWATTAEQARNTQRTIKLTIGNETLCLTDWAKRAGLKYSTLHAAHRRGEDVVARIKKAIQ